MPTIKIVEDVAWTTDKRLVDEFIQELEDLSVHSGTSEESRSWIESVLKFVGDRKAYSEKQHWAMIKIREKADKQERSWVDSDYPNEDWPWQSDYPSHED